MGSLGIPEIIFIFILALLIFGPRKLPELGRTLGRALAEFRRASTDLRAAVEDEMRELERHTQALESKARDTLNPLNEAAASPEEPVGSGSIDPHPGVPSHSAPAALQAEGLHEKPANGDSKPA